MDELLRAYFSVRRKHGKGIANKLYPDVMWYLWEKRCRLKWSRIWNPN